MAIQINAAARLQAYERYEVSAASAKDAGQVVMWLQKALDWKGKKSGKSGDNEQLTFTKKFKGGASMFMTVSLDHSQEGSPIFIEGGIDGGTLKKAKAKFMVNESSGRKSVLKLKDGLRQAVTKLSDVEGAEEIVEALKALIRAKAKVE